MKRFLILVLIGAMICTSAACAAAPSPAESTLASIEDTVILSRPESKPLVAETEYPAPDAKDVFEPAPEEEPAAETSSSAASQAQTSGPPQAGVSRLPQPENGESPEPSLPENPPAAKTDKDGASQTLEEADAAGPGYVQAQEEESDGSQAAASAQSSLGQVDGEVRAMWFSFFDLTGMIRGKSQGQFRSNITAAFQNCADLGLNTVFVQVRPHGDAFYPSQYFPWSHWLDADDEEGNDPGYDPLDIMVTAAHSMGLRIEAWVNPYRIRTDDLALSSDNPAAQWLESEDDYVISYNGGLYYNPARREVQDLIVNGVQEIVQNYAVDGIHFDDYFYPNPNNAFDQQAYDEYLAEGGSLDRGSWRRKNVDTLVKRVYQTVKNIRPSCLFGISPAGNLTNNYNQQYIDVKKWASNSGYVDYLCPQIYWSFEHPSAPYQRIAEDWDGIVTNAGVKLYVGLAAYKIGTAEAGFADNTDNMMEQVLAGRDLDSYQGFALFRYDFMFHPSSSVSAAVSQEISNLESILT